MTTIVSDLVATGASAPLRNPLVRLALATALIVLGDWLLRGPSGSSLLLLAFGTAIAAAVTNPWQAGGRRLLVAGAALLLGALPLAVDIGILPIGFALAGLAVFALLLTGQGTPGWLRRPLDIVLLYLSGPQRLLADGIAMSRIARGGNWGRHLSAASLAGWIVPLGFLGTFTLLFVDANPLLERWLSSADPESLLRKIEPGRVLLWLALLAFVWPFLQMRLAPFAWRAAVEAMLAPGGHAATRPPPLPQEPAAQAAPAIAPPSVPLHQLLLGREAIARSVVLFNLLFAVQTGLDAVYLWGGAELPAGMTYAAYAHRGAYPLIATALLAAAFILVAMRPGGPGGPGEGSPRLRALVYLFVAQNVALVASSILRLDLYVSVYSLTYWRVAAFIWMGLVAIGLVLIGLRIALRQSNLWLIGGNLIALTATLYACCFVNFAALVAGYNVEHQPQFQQSFDHWYVISLGPQAIPAIDRILEKTNPSDAPYWRRYSDGQRKALGDARQRLAATHIAREADWRAWTYRGWRLSRYLEAHPKGPEPPSPPSRRPSDATQAPVEPAPSPR